MKRYILGVIFLLILLGPVYAEISIKAEVDKVSIPSNGKVTYKLTVTTSEAHLPVVQIPTFGGFNIISRGDSTAVTFARGQRKTTLVSLFVLSPKSTGKFKIEPSVVKLKLRPTANKSEGFEIEVTAAESDEEGMSSAESDEEGMSDLPKPPPLNTPSSSGQATL
ncbi:MAG: BatD family protein [Candidatus Omnitrophota bacterium]